MRRVLAATVLCVLIASAHAHVVLAQTRPEGEMRYWRKTPTVKRIVFKMVPEAITRMAMLKRDEIDAAYLLDAPQAQEVTRDPNLKLAFSGGIAPVEEVRLKRRTP